LLLWPVTAPGCPPSRWEPTPRRRRGTAIPRRKKFLRKKKIKNKPTRKKARPRRSRTPLVQKKTHPLRPQPAPENPPSPNSGCSERETSNQTKHQKKSQQTNPPTPNLRKSPLPNSKWSRRPCIPTNSPPLVFRPLFFFRTSFGAYKNRLLTSKVGCEIVPNKERNQQKREAALHNEIAVISQLETGFLKKDRKTIIYCKLKKTITRKSPGKI